MKNIIKKILVTILIITIIASLNITNILAENTAKIITTESEYTPDYEKYLNEVKLAGMSEYESSGKYPEGAMPQKYMLAYADTSTQVYNSNFPEKYVSNCITSVKNQYGGTCWAYAGTANLESAIIKKIGNNMDDKRVDLKTFDPNLTKQSIYLSTFSDYDFSEQHLRYATAKTSNNPLGRRDTSISGGWPYDCLNYWVRGEMNGAVMEYDDPLVGNTERDLSVTELKVPFGFYVADTISLDRYPDTEEGKTNKIKKIKSMVTNYGSLQIGSYRSNQGTMYNGTHKSIYIDGSGGLHSVLIVGWDDTYPIEYFNGAGENGRDGAFIIKNSWGSGAGDNGFYYMSYDCVDKLNSLQTVSNLIKRDFYDTLYEYDQVWTENWGYATNLTDKTKLAYYNKFDKKDIGTEYLTAVSGYFFNGNSDIKIYYSQDGNPSNFVSLKAKDLQTVGDGYTYHLDDAGYKTFILDEPIKINNSTFALGFEVCDKNGNNVRFPKEYTDVVAGKSFIAQDISSTPTECSGYNVAVKAFTYHSDHIWNFGDDKFDNYAPNSTEKEITINRVIDGLSLNVNQWDHVALSGTVQGNVNNMRYNRRLALKGTGDKTRRSVNFKVFGNSDIYVTAKSSGADKRVLQLSGDNGSWGSATVDSELKTYQFSTDEIDNVYLYSQDNGIYIYSICVVEDEDNTEFSNEWNFSSSEFNNFAVSSDKSQTINGMTILKNTEIKPKNVYIDGQSYTKFLNLSGTGNNYEKGLKFNVNGSCCIQITGSSSGSDNRNIEIVDQTGNVVGTFIAEPKGKTQTFLYEGGKNTLYLHSTGGGAYIYSVVAATPDVLDNNIVFENTVDRENSEPLIPIESTASLAATLYDAQLPNEENTSGSSININIDTDKIRAYVEANANQNDNITTYNTIYEESEDKYYYNQITSENAKKFYDLISESVLKASLHQDMLKIDLGEIEYYNENTLRRDMRTAFGAFLCDNPHIFWLKTYGIQFKTYTYNQKKWIYGANIYLKNRDEITSETSILNNKTSMQNKINTILSNYNSSATEFNRYSYLIEEIRNMNTRTEDIQYKSKDSIKGVFVDGYADSKGVAKTFKVLCDQVNMPCIYAEGKYEDKYCAWNYIKINEKWYICNIYLNSYMIPLIDTYTVLNPTVYGNNSSETQIFTYPTTATERFILKWGDCDNNNYVDSRDSSIALAINGNQEEANLWHVYTLVNGDVNGDGIVNAADARLIMNFVLTGQKTTTSYSLSDPIDEFINMEIDAAEDQSGTFDIDDNGIINIYDIIEILNDMSK